MHAEIHRVGIVTNDCPIVSTVELPTVSLAFSNRLLSASAKARFDSRADDFGSLKADSAFLNILIVFISVLCRAKTCLDVSTSSRCGFLGLASRWCSCPEAHSIGIVPLTKVRDSHDITMRIPNSHFVDFRFSRPLNPSIMWWDERLHISAAHAIPPIFPAKAPTLLGKDDAPSHSGGVDGATTKANVKVSERGEKGSPLGPTSGNTPEIGGQPAALHATLDLDCPYVRHANPYHNSALCGDATVVFRLHWTPRSACWSSANGCRLRGPLQIPP